MSADLGLMPNVAAESRAFSDILESLSAQDSFPGQLRALGLEHPVCEAALRALLNRAGSPWSHKRFKADLTDTRPGANDLDWALEAGEPLRGNAQQLLMVLMDRRLPARGPSGTAAGRLLNPLIRPATRVNQGPRRNIH